jgi:hypothetical protein
VVIVFSVFLALRLLITPLVSCGHCTLCLLSLTASVLPLWYLVVIVLSVFLALRLLVTLWYLVVSVLSVFLALRPLITPLVSCGHCTLYLLIVRLRRQRVQ